MAQKIRIGILGLGGVGGYIGGFLAGHYFHSDNVEIIFITRPATEAIIKEKGLKLITPYWLKTIYPEVVTSNADKIGALDYLICAVKSYDLEDSLHPLKNCVKPQTVILPLLNGVDSKAKISKLFSQAEIWEGCIYIVSRLIKPGVVKQSGNIHALYFGSSSASQSKLKQLEAIFSDAGIECYLPENIEQAVWEKFIFISSLASLTSYLDLSIGPILENQSHKDILKGLIKEIKSIADAKGIRLSENIAENTMEKMARLPFLTTSSMHSDFLRGGKTEYASLTEYVSIEGKRMKIPTPAFDIILNEFYRQGKNIIN